MAAALCAAALLLSACSDDPPEPKPLDPPTGSGTTTAPPTSEPPKAQTPEQLIREWLQAVYDIQASGETGEFRALGHECASCGKFADRVEEIYDAGGWIRPSLKRKVTIELQEKLDSGQRVYHVDFVSPPWTLKADAKSKPDRQKGGASTYVMKLVNVDQQWFVHEYTTLVGGQEA